MPHEDYQIHDFVTDPLFRKWVLAPEDDICAYWEGWAQNHPDQRHILQEARKLVLLTHFEAVEVKGAAETKARIAATLFGQEKVINHPAQKSQLHTRRYYPMAAAISLLILLGVYFFYPFLDEPQSYTTDYGQRMEIELPDGSRALLNANSRLTIGEAWDSRREVWLEGEAFFEVKKRPLDATQAGKSYRKFSVHAGDVDIEVLGTRFNVQQRCHSTQVILEEGLVTLKENQQADSQVKMNAGDAVSFSDKDRVFKKEIVDTRAALSWKDGMHFFDATPLHEISEVLEDIYGYEVKIKNEALKKKRFSAQVPYGEVDLMIMLIQESLEVEIVQQNGSIIIK